MTKEYLIEPDQDTLKQISDNAALLKALQNKLEQSELQCSELKEEIRKIQEQVLPDLMMSVGMKQFKIAEGHTVSLHKFYDARLVDREACFQFLRDSGNDGIIKNTVKCEFGKGEEAEAQKATRALEEKGILYQRKADIHHMTLKSFVKECKENDIPIPDEAFGVYEGNKVTIKQ